MKKQLVFLSVFVYPGLLAGKLRLTLLLFLSLSQITFCCYDDLVPNDQPQHQPQSNDSRLVALQWQVQQNTKRLQAIEQQLASLDQSHAIKPLLSVWQQQQHYQRFVIKD